MSLKAKVALVTGSTSGIGLGIARALAAEGADVMLNGFGDAAAIEALRTGLATEFNVRIGYNGADISKPAQIAAMVAETEKTFGSVDILVNNAGVQFTANVEDFPDERWDQIIAINLSGVFHGMKAAIPGMKAKGWGRIINVASAHGLVASAAEGRLCRGQAWRDGRHEGRGDRAGQFRRYGERDLPRLGADAAGGKAVAGPRSEGTARRSSFKRTLWWPRSSRWRSSPSRSRSAGWRFSCAPTRRRQ